MNKHQRSTYIVLNENALGYILPDHPGWVNVLAGSVLKGGPNPLDGPVPIVPSLDRIRPATIADFEAFRVDPTGHRPAGAPQEAEEVAVAAGPTEPDLEM